MKQGRTKQIINQIGNRNQQKRIGMGSRMLLLAMIILLALGLTGCGPTLDEKIAEVREKNTLNTSDVVELLELEGVEVKQQKAGAAIHEAWEGVNVYKLDGENLLFLTQFDGAPWERDNHLYELQLSDTWAWNLQKEQPEPIRCAVQQLKPETGYYSMAKTFAYKNIIGLYIPYIPIDAQNPPTQEEMQAVIDRVTETKNNVYRTFWKDMLDMEIVTYTADGQYFSTEVTSYFGQVPYTYNDRLMYEYLETSKCLIELHEDVAQQYQEETITISFGGPLEGPFTKSGSQNLRTSVNKTLSYSMNASRENIGYGKEPYTGPIQYEVTVTIGDTISETLIVGREGAEAAE